MMRTLFFCLLCLYGPVSAAQLQLSLQSPVSTISFPRYGLNLGGASYWGAEQLRANIVRNPGFQPLLDRTLVFTAQPSGWQVREKTPWLGRADGFWRGADYHILSGEYAGSTGKVRDYRREPQQNGAFWLDQTYPHLQADEAISVQKTQAGGSIAQWWTQGRVSLHMQAGNSVARLQARPEAPARLISYFDTLGGTAGRLLPIAGEWVLRFKVRGERPKSTLQIRFSRDRQTPFLQQTIHPTEHWETVSFRWRGNETIPAKPAPLTLSFELTGDSEVWLDDVYLAEDHPHIGGFRSAVVTTLETLRPGVLRDWQGQLGDTTSNRFADDASRQPIRYRAGEHEHFFAYGIPDFLALCAHLNAIPWIVGPTTLSIREWQDFGRALREQADRLRLGEVILEFGNENWNPLFQAAGFNNVQQHLKAADAALLAAQRGFGRGKTLHTVVNAPFAWPNSPGEIVQSQHADRVAVAPYFLYSMAAGEAAELSRQRALSSQQPAMQKQQNMAMANGKMLSVYEVNFHTTQGNAPAAQRNPLLTGALSGVALARQLIDASGVGIREQAVYSLAGYSFSLPDALGDVALFGISRDLAQANRLRPTGMALSLLNEVAGGRPWRLACRGDEKACVDISRIAFQNPDTQAIGMALVNTGKASHLLQLPCQQASIHWALLDGQQSGDNEIQATIQIQRGQQRCVPEGVQLNLPAHSLLVVLPE